MAKLFITGGAGFIGSTIVRRMQRDQHDIVVYDDLSFGRRQLVDIPDDRFVQADIRDSMRLKRALQEYAPDHVIHLAAVHFIPYCNQHPFESASINIMGTATLLDALRFAPSVKSLFFASTAAVYPPHDSAVDEGFAVGPQDIYGLSKYAGEEFCRRFHLATGVPTVICRFFNAFGPNETNPHLIPAIAEQLRAGARRIQLGNTAPKRDFIHTSDMVEAVQLLLKRFTNGIDTFNLGRGIEYSVTEVVEAFSRALKEPIAIEVDDARVRRSDRPHLLADITKLCAYTGWAPRVRLEAGIKELVEEW